MYLRALFEAPPQSYRWIVDRTTHPDAWGKLLCVGEYDNLMWPDAYSDAAFEALVVDCKMLSEKMAQVAH